MQAAYEHAKGYADDRVVFAQPIAEYQLTQAKLGRMAVIIQASRQLSLHVAELMRGRHAGGLDGKGVRAEPQNGSPARRCRSTAAWVPRNTQSAATSSMPGCCRSSRVLTRRLR